MSSEKYAAHQGKNPHEVPRSPEIELSGLGETWEGDLSFSQHLFRPAAWMLSTATTDQPSRWLRGTDYNNFSSIFLQENATQEKEVGQEKTCQDDWRREASIYGTETISRRRNEEEKGRHVDAVFEGADSIVLHDQLHGCKYFFAFRLKVIKSLMCFQFQDKLLKEEKSTKFNLNKLQNQWRVIMREGTLANVHYLT